MTDSYQFVIIVGNQFLLSFEFIKSSLLVSKSIKIPINLADVYVNFLEIGSIT